MYNITIYKTKLVHISYTAGYKFCRLKLMNYVLLSCPSVSQTRNIMIQQLIYTIYIYIHAITILHQYDRLHFHTCFSVSNISETYFLSVPNRDITKTMSSNHQCRSVNYIITSLRSSLTNS